jgi:excisionase family DNA binding protein
VLHAIDGAGPWQLQVGGTTIEVPDALRRLVRQVLDTVAADGTVRIGPLPEELTTTLAAAVLGMSRPTLMRFVAAGEVPSHQVGSHTRFRAADVLAFDEALRARQRAAFDELRDLEDELGLDD